MVTILRIFNLNGVDHIIITRKEYERLVESSEKLETPENWDGYSEVMCSDYEECDRDD